LPISLHTTRSIEETERPMSGITRAGRTRSVGDRALI
jgi:hypothetical protein